MGRLSAAGMSGKQPCLSFVKNRGRMQGIESFLLSQIQEKQTKGMKKMFPGFRILCMRRTVKTDKASVLCHIGFQNIFHSGELHHVSIFPLTDCHFFISQKNSSVLSADRNNRQNLQRHICMSGYFCQKGDKIFWKKFL